MESGILIALCGLILTAFGTIDSILLRLKLKKDYLLMLFISILLMNALPEIPIVGISPSSVLLVVVLFISTVKVKGQLNIFTLPIITLLFTSCFVYISFVSDVHLSAPLVLCGVLLGIMLFNKVLSAMMICAVVPVLIQLSAVIFEYNGIFPGFILSSSDVFNMQLTALCTSFITLSIVRLISKSVFKPKLHAENEK